MLKTADSLTILTTQRSKNDAENETMRKKKIDIIQELRLSAAKIVTESQAKTKAYTNSSKYMSKDDLLSATAHFQTNT